MHSRYGGQAQGGISTPTQHPLVLVFSGPSGENYGYRDGWADDGSFRYTGEGQIGDMQFVRGNRAIRDHAVDGKDLHVFADAPLRSHVRYVGQMVCAGYDLIANVPDREGHPRTAIVFRFVPLEATQNGEVVAGESANDDTDGAGGESEKWYWTSTLSALRNAAMEVPQANQDPKIARRTLYRRSEAVRVYVLRRANGHCEGCGVTAPFVTAANRPYLEPHHTRRLSDGGPDHPAWVIALCPTCHRRAHYAVDAETFNTSLAARAQQLDQTEG